MPPIAALLSGGDQRSIGRADELVARLADGRAQFAQAWRCLRHSDPVVRMRAADALEKHTRGCPAALMPHKGDVLALLPGDGMAAFRWHLIAMASRLLLDEHEACDLCAYLHKCLRTDGSRIVRVMALQAACDIAVRVPSVQGCAEAMKAYALSSHIPSVRARGRQLSRATARQPS